MTVKFKAVVIDNQNEKFTRDIKEIDSSHLKDGNVLIKIDYSSLNYKDALILKDGGKIVRKFPFVPGIDFSGKVVESGDDKFKKDETVISIGVITNLGGDTDAYKFHSIRESNNFGGRAEISYLKGSGHSEFGPYVGFGMTTMDFGIIGGFDYRTYSGLYRNNPLKVGGQIEINYTPLGSTTGSTIVLKPSITSTTNKQKK